MYIDLHMHTIYSDGEYEPNELINLAIKNKINLISITDHDSIKAYNKINNNNIKIIPGIELTSYYKNKSIHILGYNIDINNKKLNEYLDKFRTNKFYVIIKCLNYLKDKHNIEFSSYDIANLFNKKGNISRSDLAKLLLNYKLVNSINEAYDKYLIAAYNEINIEGIKTNPIDIIKLIHEANGIAVLAHPKELKYEDNDKIINYLIENNIDGIEAYHSLHNEKDIEKYLKIAKNNNLLITCGSDFHGPDIKEKIPITYAKDNNYTEEKTNIINYE